MFSRLSRIIIAIFVFFSMFLPIAVGQIEVERGVKGTSPSDDSSGSSPAALPYFAMAIYTMLILTIVCMPSRKA